MDDFERDAHKITAPDGSEFVALAGSAAYEGHDGYQIEEVRRTITPYGFRYFDD